MSNILTGFNMQGNDPIDDRIVSKSNLETLEQYLKRVPVQKRYYGLTFFALDKNNELRKYTFQTSLINPTIDDYKELQEHVSDKAIHKTSEEIRSEIVDADIPDTISRVQWTLDQINTAVINLIGGASDEYNTLKRIQTKIEELRAKIYGDDGGTVLNTLEQALKFLNQYKDFIVDIPENFVSKQDIVDNLTTDDPTKVLSAKQGKVLSDTLTNYFESAMQSIRTETDRAINAENRIETKLDKEIDRSIKEDQRIDAKLDAEIKRSTDEDLRIDSKLDSEINRSTTEDDRLDKKIDAETTRATDAESNLNTKIETETDRAEREESRIETKLDNEIARSTNKDTEHDNRLTALEGDTHEQNTDLGTTNSTFQLKYNTGNKIKHESDAISVRNAADTDYVNFIAKNATFKGDLLVEGQSFVTEAETVEIKDNLLLLNKGEVGAGVTKGIAGLEIDRGTEPNYQIIFDESDNRFKAGEIGDIQCLALRDGDNSMVNGMFTSWDSSTKRLKTTNIVPSDQKLLFGDNGDIELKYSLSKMGETLSSAIPVLNIGRKSSGYPHIEFGLSSKYALVYTDALNGIYLQNQVLGKTFKRATDLSEVLYHADIVNNLTSGGTNKVLSAEQGKLLQNSITSIQGSYLPLSGGTMTGSINLPSTDPLKMIISGSVDSVLSYWPSNNAIEFGNNKRKIFLRTDNSNIIHYINGSSYSIYDAYNLPDPVTLSGNNTFTGNNTFQVDKFNVGPFKVTRSGSLLLNISTPAGSGWSRNLTFQANSDATSKLVFGGDNSTNNTSAGYAYIGVGDVNYSTVQYKFYSGRLEVPMIWRLTAGSNNILNVNLENNFISLGSVSSSSYIVSNNSDLKHRRFTTTSAYKDYIVWDSYNLPTPASTTDLANYLPLIGGTLTGQLTIKQSVDIKLRLQSTDADNHCIIQAIDSQASQLGVFGYAGDKWAIGHGGTYYEIWDKYNLANPVTYTTNTYNHATLTNKDGQYFTYIKAGTNGLLPHSKATLASGGSGSLGTSDQSFNAAYINNLHTNKITFGETGPYITGSTSATQFLNAEGGSQKVATGSLYVGTSYASDALSLVPANGIYSRGIIYIENGIGFRNSIWTNDLTPNRNYSGYLQVLDAYDANNAGGPTNYGTVLQVNSRNAHWANQLWFSGGAEASKNGLYYRHMAYNETTYGEWHRLLTNKDVNIIQTQSSSNPSTLPANQIFYSEIKGVAGTPTTNGSLFSVQGDDEGIQLWASSNRTDLYYRTKWTSFGNWIKLATTSDIGNYLPLTGGTLSGNLTINTVGSTTFVINNNDTNGSETFMRVLRKGTASAAIGFMDGLGAYIYNYNSNKYLFIDNDGYVRVGTTNGSTRLALITDIPTVSGYLPLSGGTMTGALTMNSRKNNAVIDVVGGTGNNWNGGAGALSVQVPGDGGQTPLLVARRSGAAIDTTTAAERLLSMELLNTGNTFRITLSNTSTFQLDLSTAKGFLFGKTIATTDQIPSIPSISISNSGSGNAVTAISASGHTLTVTKGATYLTSHQTIYNLTFQAGTFAAKTFDPNGAAATVNIPTKTSHLTNDSGFITSSALNGYATQSWANGQFAPLSRFNTSTGYTTIKVTGQEFNFDSANPEIYMNYRTLSGSTAVTKITWKGGSNSTLCEGRWGNLYMNDNLVATQSWAAEKFPNKTGTGASGTWGISITGNAATATNATQLGGTAASSYVKANDNISRLTNDSGYTTQEWVNGQGFLTSDSLLDKFVPTTGGYIRNSDQVLLRIQRTGVSTGTSRTIEMYFDDSNTDGTSTTPRGSIGYNSEVGMFLYSATSKKFLAMEYTGRPFYGTPENRYYLLGSNTQYHNPDGYQRIGDIMIQWGYFTVQGNSTRAVNFPVSFTSTVWSVTGSWDNTTTGSQENWGFSNYTSSGFTIINGDGDSRVFHYIAIGPFTRS